MRSDERYFADIRHAIRNFYRPGDQLRLVRQYRESRKYEMCGGMVDIVNCYDLRNVRSGEIIVCGEKCIARYADVIAQMGQTPTIVFPPEYRDKADKVNQHRRDTVIIEPEPEHAYPGPEEDQPDEDAERAELYESLGLDPDDPDFGELAAEGLDPDEYDWDSHDYGPD